MGALSWWHWAIVLVVLIVLFGSKKLPDAARGLGRSMRIFKSEMTEMTNDGKGGKHDDTPADDEKASKLDAPRELTSGESGADVNANVTEKATEDKKSA